MATQVYPKKNAAFSFEIGLPSQADTKLFQTSATLAAGDVKVYQDGVLDGNIDTLPTEIGSSGVLVVAMSAAEMNCDRVVIAFHDVAGSEWCDVFVPWWTVTNQMDDLATAANLQTVDDNVDLVLADTNELQTDDVPGLIAAVDAKIDTIDTNVDSVLADTGTDGVVVAVASKTGYALSAAGVDGVLDEVVEGTYTMRQMLRLLAAALCGKASGGGTTTVTFRDTGDGTDRIVATVDASGNRTAVVLDET